MNDFASKLILWYQENKRDLPWRNTRDPYLIWISEIILQQTRVAQGYEYFLRFIRRFPNLEALSKASLDEVLKYWEGLGYYSRARNLHTAVRQMRGVFPSTYKEVLALKGVGEYTAAAICSFAYKMPYAVADGNVYRILSRLFGIDTPIDSAGGRKRFVALAQQLLDKDQPDIFNQAIMDFGALVCTPLSPRCAECPFNKTCRAFINNQTACLPVKTGKNKVSPRFFSYIYAEQDRCIWLHKRNGPDIWQGLYELPLIESERELSVQTLKKTSGWKQLFGRLSPRPWGSPVKHILSHQVISARFFKVAVPSSFSMPEGYICILPDELIQYPLPRLIQKFLQEKQIISKADLAAN